MTLYQRCKKWLFNKNISSAYEVEDVIRRIMIDLMPVQNKKEILNIIAQKLQQYMRVGHIWLFLNKQDEFSLESLVPELEVICPIKIGYDHPFIRFFQETMDVLPFGRLKEDVRLHLEEHHISPYSICLPLHSLEKLQALFIIGPYQEDRPYSSKDLVLFESLLSQVLLVFDRINQMEQLKKLYRQMGSYNKKIISLNSELQENLTQQNSLKEDTFFKDQLSQKMNPIHSFKQSISIENLTLFFPIEVSESLLKALKEQNFLDKDGHVFPNKDWDNFNWESQFNSYKKQITWFLSFFQHFSHIKDLREFLDSSVLSHSKLEKSLVT